MNNFCCAICQKNFMLAMQSKTVWRKRGEAVYLAVSRHPENLPMDEQVQVCAPCVIKTLAGFLRLEGEELAEVFA